MGFNSELFAADIVEMRYQKRLNSMSACAQEIGVSKATLSRIERNKLPDVGSLIKILKWTGTPFEKYIV